MSRTTLTITLFILLLNYANSVVLHINETHFCYIRDFNKNLSVCHPLEGNFIKGYNKTHAWFEVDDEECTSKLEDLIKMGICERDAVAHGKEDVNAPAKCGKDIHGKPVKCSRQFEGKQLIP